ncbi:hypothetical protein AMJ83_11740 [candidate division WOR_3 bacterium SM23_42]|uniref:Uncharacterized protein n=1 Tax=candidate division WOR_3 bacterium SM23_42 TaxID=1703779 RepID=A0A0S8FP29_UNCW3|nr:MAG: hypothetical protein AMJ83_11740 [candidate division WOR_3 bacterium SM23_42]
MEVYESRPLLPVGDVSLSDDSHLNRDLSLVARSATQEFSTLFSLPPPAGIRPVDILYCSQGPYTNSTSDTTRYKVYLTVKNRDYVRLVYQLGHELCHIFADPRRTNWFVESCCEMAALVLLRRMSKLWINNPPYANWSSFAPEFQKSAHNRIRDAKEAEEPSCRQGYMLNAEILCPLFRESLESWNALCYLGQASTCPPEPEDLTDWNRHLVGFSFDRWLQAVPNHLKGIVRRIYKTPKDLWHY